MSHPNGRKTLTLRSVSRLIDASCMWNQASNRASIFREEPSLRRTSCPSSGHASAVLEVFGMIVADVVIFDAGKIISEENRSQSPLAE